MQYPTPPSGNPGPVGNGEYVVQQGDCIESIAASTGHFWQTIWNHPQNAALKTARVCPNILLPGDRVYIPDRQRKDVTRPTDQQHRFVKKANSSKFRICVKKAGVPRANERYVLVIDGQPYNGNTDAQGWIEVAIPPDAQSGSLTVGIDPLHQEVFSLELGGMDPLTEVSGIQMRLRNLGYPCASSGEMDEATSRAIALFQEREGLKTSGKADRDTIQKLQKRYGS
jgi:hypothetical protein